MFKIKKSTINIVLGILIFVELFAFGSGRILTVSGNLTMRIINFGLMILISGWYAYIKVKVPYQIIFFFFFFLLLLLIGSSIGFVNGARDLIFIDIKLQSYFLTILFMFYYISDIAKIRIVVTIFKYTVLGIAILYVIYLILIFNNVLDYHKVYELLSIPKDFKFRGISGVFFYKGFIYLPLVLLLFLIEKRISFLPIFILLVAIYYTQTRSFWILGVLAVFAGIIYKLKRNNFKISLISFVIFNILLLGAFVFIAFNFNGVDGARLEGDEIRIETIVQVIDRVNVVSLFVGHGLGVGVPIRPVHMEIVYMEIFHKQGLLGLLFWFMLLIDSLRMMVLARKEKALAFFFGISILLIYIQSMFNPFLINSMGIGFILVAYISLYRIKLNN
jgi:hypothetical protein